MAALVPLNNVEALPRLLEVGVEEVYVGFHDDAWEARFPGVGLNRMSGFGEEANPFDFLQMCEQIARAHALGIRAFVCFNASTYTLDQIEYIAATYLTPIAEAGAQGIIVSGQGLIEDARNRGLDVVISTVAGVFNERLAAYYRDLGATRLILPRDLSADEIAGIMQAIPNLEYEVFMMRNGCMFSDSHCLGCHRSGHPSLCMSLRTGDWTIMESNAEMPGTASESWSDMRLPEENSASSFHSMYVSEFGPNSQPDGSFIARARYNEWLLNTYYHKRTCGLCALWRFEQLGVHAYKVVGRGDDVDDLVLDAELVVRNTEIARRCASESEYLANMELPRYPETLCGMNGLSCYYPELARTYVT